MLDKLVLPSEGRILCAVSGGADSTALLHALCAFVSDGRVEGVAAGHFHHGLRASADRDEAFVRDFCRSLGVECLVGRADVAAEAESAGTGIEVMARALRYEFLAQAAERAGCVWIATAHTADDNVETVLLNLVRGAGPAGLRGIPGRRGHVLRPMLPVTRSEVVAYIEANGLSHVEDESNADITYRRNLIRHKVVPVLLRCNPALCESVRQTTLLLREDDSFLTSLARETYEAEAEAVTEGVSFPAARLRELPRPIASRVCRLMASELGRYSIEFYHVQAMLALCAEGRADGALSMPGGLVARRSFDELILGPDVIYRLEEGLELEVEPLPYEKIEPVSGEYLTFYIAAGSVTGELVIRERRTGDSLRVMGREGTKTLKKWFIEQKIPQRLRSAVPIIADGDGVVAVAGLGVAERCRPLPGGDVLKLTIKGGAGL